MDTRTFRQTPLAALRAAVLGAMATWAAAGVPRASVAGSLNFRDVAALPRPGAHGDKVYLAATVDAHPRDQQGVAWADRDTAGYAEFDLARPYRQAQRELVFGGSLHRWFVTNVHSPGNQLRDTTNDAAWLALALHLGSVAAADAYADGDYPVYIRRVAEADAATQVAVRTYDIGGTEYVTQSNDVTVNLTAYWLTDILYRGADGRVVDLGLTSGDDDLPYSTTIRREAGYYRRPLGGWVRDELENQSIAAIRNGLQALTGAARITTDAVAGSVMEVTDLAAVPTAGLPAGYAVIYRRSRWLRKNWADRGAVPTGFAAVTPGASGVYSGTLLGGMNPAPNFYRAARVAWAAIGRYAERPVDPATGRTAGDACAVAGTTTDERGDTIQAWIKVTRHSGYPADASEATCGWVSTVIATSQSLPLNYLDEVVLREWDDTVGYYRVRNPRTPGAVMERVADDPRYSTQVHEAMLAVWTGAKWELEVPPASPYAKSAQGHVIIATDATLAGDGRTGRPLGVAAGALALSRLAPGPRGRLIGYGPDGAPAALGAGTTIYTRPATGTGAGVYNLDYVSGSSGPRRRFSDYDSISIYYRNAESASVGAPSGRAYYLAACRHIKTADFARMVLGTTASPGLALVLDSNDPTYVRRPNAWVAWESDTSFRVLQETVASGTIERIVGY